MKKVLFLISFSFLMSSALCLNAQEVQLATLQHGENLQVFYGGDALKNAMEAADAGDLITLSAGTFNAVNITKALIIQGAGYVTDPENVRYPTAIVGDFTIQLPAGIEGLLIEGIFSNNTISVSDTLTGATIKKSRINTISFTNGHTVNCLIDQCRIASALHPDSNSENLYLKNSIVRGIDGNSSSTIFTVENCVIIHSVSSSTTGLFKNNIIAGVLAWNTLGASLASTCSAYNNVCCSGNANAASVNSGNMSADKNTLFGKDINDYSDSETYELTEESKTAYLGTDGRQVGVYGGDVPFTDVPTNPQITQRNIAPRSTPEGKLHVSIKVEAQN
jgi:hypothetical protein